MSQLDCETLEENIKRLREINKREGTTGVKPPTKPAATKQIASTTYLLTDLYENRPLQNWTTYHTDPADFSKMSKVILGTDESSYKKMLKKINAGIKEYH